MLETTFANSTRLGTWTDVSNRDINLHLVIKQPLEITQQQNVEEI